MAKTIQKIIFFCVDEARLRKTSIFFPLRQNVWVCVCVGFVMCGCFGNMYTCICCVFVLFRLCIYILICY
jgi:hypothetical protein